MPSLHTLARDPLVEILLDQQQEQRTATFPLGIDLQGMSFQAMEMGTPDGGGEWGTEYGLAVYEATFGKPATVLDYT